MEKGLGGSLRSAWKVLEAREGLAAPLDHPLPPWHACPSPPTPESRLLKRGFRAPSVHEQLHFEDHIPPVGHVHFIRKLSLFIVRFNSRSSSPLVLGPFQLEFIYLHPP